MMGAEMQLLRLPDVLRQTGVSRSSIYARIRAGQFPRPIALGPRTSAWLATDVTAWIEQKVNESRGENDQARTGLVKDVVAACDKDGIQTPVKASRG